MTDKLPALAGCIDKVAEIYHLVDNGLPRFMTLLDCRDDDLIKPYGPHHLALGELAVQEGELVEAHLGSLLCHPLYTVHHLGRSNGQVDMPTPGRLLRHHLLHLIHTALGGSQCHLSTIEVSHTVHQEHLVTTLDAQYSQGMKRLIHWHLGLGSRIGHIEKSGLFHQSVISLFLVYLPWDVAFSAHHAGWKPTRSFRSL